MVNNKTKQELFIATLMHDLKNPLFAQINSLNQLLKGVYGELNKEQQEILELLLNSCKYMQDLLATVLTTYKNDNGEPILNKNYFNSINLLKTCINQYQNLFDKNNITIHFQNNLSDKKQILFADEKQIRRVIENIFINQIFYSTKNTNINIEINQKDDKLIFIFENYSNKINKTIQNEMFEKYKTSNTLKQNTSIGLGMYLAKQIIEAHQGKIYLICEGNKNKFVIELPQNNTTASQIIW